MMFEGDDLDIVLSALCLQVNNEEQNDWITNDVELDRRAEERLQYKREMIVGILDHQINDLDFGVSIAKDPKIKKELEWTLAHKKEFRKIWQQKVENGKIKPKEANERKNNPLTANPRNPRKGD